MHPPPQMKNEKLVSSDFENSTHNSFFSQLFKVLKSCKLYDFFFNNLIAESGSFHPFWRCWRLRWNHFLKPLLNGLRWIKYIRILIKPALQIGLHLFWQRFKVFLFWYRRWPAVSRRYTLFIFTGDRVLSAINIPPPPLWFPSFFTQLRVLSHARFPGDIWPAGKT